MQRTPKWATGMQKLGPGIYVDEKRTMHLSESEICEHFGVPYTQENIEVIEAAATAAFREAFPEAPISVFTRHDEVDA